MLEKIFKSPKKEKYGESEANNINNAKQMPKVYYARHIENGIVRYDNEDVYVSNEVLNKMDKTFAGKPVYIYHRDVDLDTLQQDMDGVVSESFYNNLDGWHWLKFVAISDEAHRCLKEGYSVSNSYGVTTFGSGGQYHNIPYQREIKDGEYLHLALVPKPRYEGAKVMSEEDFKAYNKDLKKQYDNSIIKKGGLFTMRWKLFEKKEVEKAENLDNAIIEMDGKEYDVKKVIEALRNEKEKEKKEEKKEDLMKKKINVAGKEMTVGEAIKEYEAMCKKNAEMEEEEEKKKNKEEEKKKKEEEKGFSNSKELLDKIKEADVKEKTKEEIEKIENEGKVEAPRYETRSEKLARGKEKY